MNNDLTIGKPSIVLWKYSLPLFLSVIFQQLYNIADSLIAGKCIGENALAAVGNSYEITLIFIAFAFGCNIGCSVIVSGFFGGKRYGDMKSAVSTSMIASGFICLMLMLAGILFGGNLLHLINTPESIFKDSELYLKIYVFGLPFVFFYNIATGIFSALGDSKTPFFFLAASSSVNVLMDILFVKSLGMGVAGVAWATFICQGISCVLALLFVFLRLKSLKSEEHIKLFSWKICGQIAKITVPSILQQSFISVGNIVIQGVINNFGEAVIAGYSASIKLNNLVITSFTTIGNGISNFTAQNIGAKKPERIGSGFKAGLKMVWLLSLPLALLYFFIGQPLVLFFMNHPSEAAVSSGMEFLKIVSPFYFVVSAKLVADGILRGVGKMNRFMVATLTDLLIRVAVAVVLSSTSLGATGIWWAWPVGWVVATVLSMLFYKTLKFQKT